VWTWVCLGLLLAAAAFSRLAIGTTGWVMPGSEGWEVVLGLRLDRLIVAAVAGASLAVAGVALQSLLRNPLAEPFILGLSTGAAAGMMLQWWLAGLIGLALPSAHLGALVGAGLSMAIVFAAGRRRGVIDPLALLLTGVVLSTINGAMIMLFHHLGGAGGTGGSADRLMRWMMGFLNVADGSVSFWYRSNVVPWSLLIAMAALVVGGAMLWRRADAMDISTLDAGEAQALGVPLARMRVLMFTVSGVLSACAVVLAGPIAFVGLICPHIGRLWVGPIHRDLLPASAILGAVLLIAADTLSAALAVVLVGSTIPIGVFTAVGGGVVFLWMLREELRR
jgi:iron complex transport system permease protein